MPQVASWDYANRRYHLSFDTVTAGTIDFAQAYLEERAYRAASGEDVRGMRPMLKGEGFVAKGGGRFTERYVLHLEGARPVPYDTSHTLRMLVEPVTQENNPADALSGVDVFDRTPLSPGTEVNIDVGYSQVEIITIASGSGLSTQQATQLSNVAATLATPGVFSTAALANAPSSSGSGATPQQIWEYNGQRTLTALPETAALEASVQAALTAIAALNDGDATATNQAAILSAIAQMQDILDLLGYTDGKPVTVNKATGDITQGSKRVQVADTETTTVITRNDP